MKILFKDKTYGSCRSYQTCEFYGIHSNGLWCGLPYGEVHYFKSKRLRPIKQDGIFKI